MCFVQKKLICLTFKKVLVTEKNKVTQRNLSPAMFLETLHDRMHGIAWGCVIEWLIDLEVVSTSRYFRKGENH